jgi:hypothetical protein
MVILLSYVIVRVPKNIKLQLGMSIQMAVLGKSSPWSSIYKPISLFTGDHGDNTSTKLTPRDHDHASTKEPFVRLRLQNSIMTRKKAEIE